MIDRAARWLPLALSAVLLLSASPAAADILPEPQRPPWNEEPAPMPEPPPDDGAARGALVLVAAALAAGAWAVSRRRRARPAPSRHVEERA
jgi:hypothetical protein